MAVQAAIHLALRPEGSCQPVRELAAEIGVPATYLTKVLQGLTRAGLLLAVRGPGGGVQLARPAREVSLWDVLSAMEPITEFDRCFLGLKRCAEDNPCALHDRWAPVRMAMLQMLKTQTIRDFANEAVAKGIIPAATVPPAEREPGPGRTGL